MATLTFVRRPLPIFPEYRPIYKIFQVLLVLKLSSRGRKSSLLRLQFFNWALKDSNRRKIVEDAVKLKSLKINLWTMDPALNIALQYAYGEGLLEFDGKMYSLTSKGDQYVGAVQLSGDERVDKDFLERIGVGVTEKMIEEVSSRWG